MDFGKSRTNNLVNTVMQKVEDTNLDNKKRDIDVDLIDLNPDNEYIFGYDDVDFLTREIEDSGFNGAIEVYATKNGRYEISSGHRRYLAAKANGMKKVPCIISEDVDSITKAERMIMANVHHRKMSPLKWARALEYYDKEVLIKKPKKSYEGKRREALARKFNMSQTTVTRYLSLLKLIPELQEYADKPNFPYNILIPLINYNNDEQKILYKRMSESADNGEISNLSIKTVTFIVNKYESEKQAKQRKEIDQKDSIPAKSFREDESIEEAYTSSSKATNNGIQKFEPDKSELSVEPTEYAERNDISQPETPDVVYNDILFHIRKIESFINSEEIQTSIEKKDKIKESLLDVIESLS